MIEAIPSAVTSKAPSGGERQAPRHLAIKSLVAGTLLWPLLRVQGLLQQRLLGAQLRRGSLHQLLGALMDALKPAQNTTDAVSIRSMSRSVCREVTKEGCLPHYLVVPRDYIPQGAPSLLPGLRLHPPPETRGTECSRWAGRGSNIPSGWRRCMSQVFCFGSFTSDGWT